jgi:6-phospho-beta-glucosidase
VARRGLRGVLAIAPVKVAFVGGGGFRTPLVYEALVGISSEVRIEQLILHDADAVRLERIATVIEGLDRARGAGLSVRTTRHLHEAVEGAATVFVAIRPGGLAARLVDESVPLELGVLGQETVGPGGIAFALRTVPEVVRIAQVVRQRAPQAWLVNFTNPVGVVTEATREVLGSRAVGICDSPTALWRNASVALGRDAAKLRPAYAGLNHLGWLTALHHGDRNVLPDLLETDRIDNVPEARLAGLHTVRELGLIPNEYLVYYRSTSEVIRSFRREGARAEILAGQQARFYEAAPEDPTEALTAWRTARDERHGTYLAEAHGTGTAHRAPGGSATSDELGYGDVAAGFLHAVASDARERLILDVPNNDVVPWLDPEATVEVCCVVGRDGPRRDRVGDLPPEERALTQRVRDAERSTLEAARSPSRPALVDAVASHPLVRSRDLAERIADGYLQQHAWMRERFG